jgi:hypothetical protein
MAVENINYCIKVAACICAKDGIISEAEEHTMFQVLAEKFPECDKGVFELALTEFFDSDDQIEDYLGLIKDERLRKFTLLLAETSAGADGLDIKENIALEKAYLLWGVNRHA